MTKDRLITNANPYIHNHDKRVEDVEFHRKYLKNIK